MSKKKKLHLKIKKKNFTIFIIIILLIIFGIIKTTNIIINLTKEKKEIKETLTPKEKKLKELNNINKN